MSFSIWQIMLVIGLAMLICAIVLFIVWNIFDKISEVSGKKAKKQIEEIRELNHSSVRLDRLSTNEIYSSIENVQQKDLDNVNIGKEQTDANRVSKPRASESPNHNTRGNGVQNQVEQDVVTGYMEMDEDGVGTSDLGEDDDDVPTGALDDGMDFNRSVVVIEEQSSLD